MPSEALCEGGLLSFVVDNLACCIIVTMNKGLITLMAGVGTTVGGYIPAMLGAGGFSGWSILGGLVGGIVGIWAGVKLSE